MNRIVREHYPVAELPEDLKQMVRGAQHVRVVIESEDTTEGDEMFDAVNAPPAQVMTLDELLAMRRPPYKTTDEIVAEIRKQRDEWD